MSKKAIARKRVKIRIRKRISGTEDRPRISVFRSEKHTYAQAVCDVNGKTIVGVSTKDKDVLALVKELDAAKAHTATPARSTKGVLAARAVGLILGKRMIEKGHKLATFDRNGFVYHGRISAVADGAREAGLEF